MRTHRLKVHPSAFKATLAGLKPWEYRLNDRDYMVGDHLRLEEWDPGERNEDSPSGATPEGDYTGAAYTVLVTHVVHGTQFSIPAGYCVLTIDKDVDQGEASSG